jgi:hypothetical protein
MDRFLKVTQLNKNSIIYEKSEKTKDGVSHD